MGNAALPGRSLRRLANRMLRRVGLELHASRPRAAAQQFDPVSDAIYDHAEGAFLVPVERCFYPYVHCYAPSGWHPFVATLLEFLADPTLGYRDSTLYRYYSQVQPKTARALLFEPGADDEGAERLDDYPLSHYLPPLPWDPRVFSARGEKGMAASQGNQGFGPVSDEKGELEFRRLAATLASIAARGYQPLALGDGHIRGYFLKTPGDYRFVIRSGLHRTAVLAALGEPQVPVAFHRHFPRAIHLADVRSWPLVHSGVYSAAAAERYFRRFFQEDGRLKAARLGLLPLAPDLEPERAVDPSQPSAAKWVAPH